MDLFAIDTGANSNYYNQKSSSNQKRVYYDDDDDSESEVEEQEQQEYEDKPQPEVEDGILPHSKDISALISQTLSNSQATKKDKKCAVFEDFAKSLGWDQKKPQDTKPASKQKKKWIEFPELDLITGKAKDGYSETVVAKELEKTNLKSLELQHQVLNVSEKRLKQMRKVSSKIIVKRI